MKFRMVWSLSVSLLLVCGMIGYGEEPKPVVEEPKPAVEKAVAAQKECSQRLGLQIEITNTWNNRLVADAALPEGERQSHVSQPYRFNPKAKLAKSGLLGPVKVKQQR